MGRTGWTSFFSGLATRPLCCHRRLAAPYYYCDYYYYVDPDEPNENGARLVGHGLVLFSSGREGWHA
jgi:hypothetical protein